LAASAKNGQNCRVRFGILRSRPTPVSHVRQEAAQGGRVKELVTGCVSVSSLEVKTNLCLDDNNLVPSPVVNLLADAAQHVFITQTFAPNRDGRKRCLKRDRRAALGEGLLEQHIEVRIGN